MRDITKKRITSIVHSYRKLMPRQYKMAALANKARAESQKSDWGETVDSNIIEREELRMPTDLHNIIYGRLTPEEQTEFESDNGILWFQRTFPEWVPNRKKG